MAVLDDLSGFEFEDLIEDVFRNLGYENVRQAERTADEGRTVSARESAVIAHLDGPLTRVVEGVASREFDNVEVLLVAVDAVRRILDTVSQQEHRLVEMLHVPGIEEVSGVVGPDVAVGVGIQIELHRAQFVEQEELGSSVPRPALGPRRVEELLELRQIPKHTGWIPVAMPVHLCDLTVVVGRTVVGVDTPDESQLSSRSGSPAHVRRHLSPAQNKH